MSTTVQANPLREFTRLGQSLWLDDMASKTPLAVCAGLTRYREVDAFSRRPGATRDFKQAALPHCFGPALLLDGLIPVEPGQCPAPA
jgi:hypothetical protein